jgi:hypothetical protein
VYVYALVYVYVCARLCGERQTHRNEESTQAVAGLQGAHEGSRLHIPDLFVCVCVCVCVCVSVCVCVRALD